MKDFSGQILADKYRVDSLMRDGALGDFYHGTHLLMEKPVTIRILPPALAVDENIVQSFSTEAKTLARISHPNILNVTDTGTDKSGAVFTVFENAEGETLEETIRSEGRFSPERANRIVRQIAAALAVAHNNGIIHRNLTSENVLLTKTTSETDAVKLLNFAFADENGVVDEEFSTYKAEFLSPEQCSQASEADARSDVYSLGVILYEMLAGEVPFAAEKASDVMLKQAQEPPLPLSAFRTDVSSDVETVVLTALAKNPDSRFQTATEMAAALNRVTLLTGAAAAGDSILRPNFSEQARGVGAIPAEDNSQNNIWKTSFIVLAGIAVLSAFFIYLTQVKQTNPQTQMQTDANGQPVQPVNPPVGSSEQSLSNMGAYSPEAFGNTNSVTGAGGGMPQVMPGGDGYDPWARGGIPPKGAPPQNGYGAPYIPPSGTYYDANINPNSPFMQDGNTYILVPKNANSNVNAQTKKNAANSNTQTAPPNTKPTPNAPAANTSTPAETKPATTATPKNAKPTPKPTAEPKKDTTQKTSPSGKQLDT